MCTKFSGSDSLNQPEKVAIPIMLPIYSFEVQHGPGCEKFRGNIIPNTRCEASIWLVNMVSRNMQLFTCLYNNGQRELDNNTLNRI